MIKSVFFLSRIQVETNLKPSLDTSIISITDPLDSPINRVAYIPSGYKSIIRLSFHDLYEENLGEIPNAFPDCHVDHRLGVRLFYAGYELCDFNDASKIFKFTENLHALAEPVNVIAHCEAGVSRSAAVAKFISNHYQVPIVQSNNDTSASNKRLLRLLEKAADIHHVMTTGLIVETPSADKEWASKKISTYTPLGLF